jgi:hypothetical protein
VDNLEYRIYLECVIHMLMEKRERGKLSKKRYMFLKEKVLSWFDVHLETAKDVI